MGRTPQKYIIGRAERLITLLKLPAHLKAHVSRWNPGDGVRWQIVVTGQTNMCEAYSLPNSGHYKTALFERYVDGAIEVLEAVDPDTRSRWPWSKTEWDRQES